VTDSCHAKLSVRGILLSGRVVVIPITDRHVEYGRGIITRLFDSGFRVEIDDSDKRMNPKIRGAQLKKVSCMLVVGDQDGDQEVSSGAVAVRLRSGEDMGKMRVREVEGLPRQAVEGRSLSLVA
jgi:threonyl-tRNA synthetase